MKNKDNFLILLSSLLTLSLGLFTLSAPYKSFSQKENRPLAGAPAVSLEGIVNGEYFEELSLFLKDQLALRDTWVSLHALCELGLLKLETNGVIYASGGRLITRPSKINVERLRSNAERITSLSGGKALLYVPPRSIDAFRDLLPSAYDYESEFESFGALEGETLLMLEEFLSLRSRANYYRTDHHWTTDGAYFAYTQICDRFSIDAAPKEYFSIEEVTDSFRGTSFSRSGLPMFAISPESIYLYRYKNDSLASVINRETNEQQSGFYDLDALSTLDGYRVFLGGNYSHLSIRLNDGVSRPKLLLIKDSFANSLIPFLALHYDLEVIDPRYCAPSLLVEHLKDESYAKVLALMSFDTLEGVR